MRHVAFFYNDASRYLAGLLKFIRGGLARDEPVLIAVPSPHLERLRTGLAPAEAAHVWMRDMSVAGRNPGRILGSLLTAFVQQHPGRQVRIVSEVIGPDRTGEEYPACVEHEALVNLALADAAAEILCPYDAATLPRSVLTDAARNHPTLAWGDERSASPSYEGACAATTSLDQPLSAPPDDAEMVVVNKATGARTARQRAFEFGQRMGLPPPRLNDLTITVQELAVNTIVHAGGSGLLSVWTADEHIVVQTEDGGRITDPLVGRRPPGPAEIGHGLYVVHQLADLVRIHRTGDGTTVRAYFRRGTIKAHPHRRRA